MSNPNKELLGNVLADIESDENLIEYIQPQGRRNVLKLGEAQ